MEVFLAPPSQALLTPVSSWAPTIKARDGQQKACEIVLLSETWRPESSEVKWGSDVSRGCPAPVLQTCGSRIVPHTLHAPRGKAEITSSVKPKIRVMKALLRKSHGSQWLLLFCLGRYHEKGHNLAPFLLKFNILENRIVICYVRQFSFIMKHKM